MDLLLEKQRVIVEVDSRLVHFNPEAQELDIARDNAIVAAMPRFSLQHWTFAAMKARPKQLADNLRTLFRSRADATA